MNHKLLKKNLLVVFVYENETDYNAVDTFGVVIP